MSETYFFNTHNVKTDEVNSEKILIYPRYGSKSTRVDILDLLEKETSHPFKVDYELENLIEGTYASGWFNASALPDGKIKLNGIEYDANGGAGDNIGEKFVDVINKDEYAPVTAALTLKDGVRAKGWFIPQYLSDNTIIIDGVEYTLEEGESSTITSRFADYLNSIPSCPVTAIRVSNKIAIVAKEEGTSGNNITLACKAEPYESNALSGATLTDGEDQLCIVTLTAKDIGEEGNTVFIESIEEPTIENWCSGEELDGGTDSYYLCTINSGNIYLPGKTLCPILTKSDFRIPIYEENNQIVLQLIRDGSGKISYQYKLVDNIEEEGYTVVSPEEIK